jgi:hypothetical protein
VSVCRIDGPIMASSDVGSGTIDHKFIDLDAARSEDHEGLREIGCATLTSRSSLPPGLNSGLARPSMTCLAGLGCRRHPVESEGGQARPAAGEVLERTSHRTAAIAAFFSSWAA